MMMNVTGYAEAYPEFVTFIKKNGELLWFVNFSLVSFVEMKSF